MPELRSRKELWDCKSQAAMASREVILKILSHFLYPFLLLRKTRQVSRAGDVFMTLLKCVHMNTVNFTQTARWWV